MSLFVIHRVDERGQHVFFSGALGNSQPWTAFMRDAKKYDTEGEARRAVEALNSRPGQAAAEVREGALV